MKQTEAKMNNKIENAVCIDGLIKDYCGPAEQQEKYGSDLNMQ